MHRVFGLSGSVWAALLSVYIFWGGTYLAGRFALETIPPMVVTSARFLVAGVLLYIVESLRGWERTGWKGWRDAAISGFFLLCLGNGALVWAQQYIPSGIAAIILGITPMWLVLLSCLMQKGPRPNGLVWSGLVLGFTGIALLAKDAATEQGGNYLFGACLVMGCSFFWALGSVCSRMAKQPRRPLQWVAMQTLSGGGLLLAAALFTGQWQKFDPTLLSLKSLGGIMYLIFCGSLLGYASYIWLLNNAPASLAATYAYVNPLVAVLVGWLFAGETMGTREALAAAVIITAVILITIGNGRNTARNPHPHQR